MSLMDEKAINLQKLREHNVDIITSLLTLKPMSCLEIASKINISDVAVNKIIKQLVSINMITQNKEVISVRKKGGQHIRYNLNPYIGIYICVDFTHKKDRVIIYDFSGKKLIDYFIDTLYVQTFDEINKIINEIKNKIAKILPLYSNNILTVILSIPGQVRFDNSILFSSKFKDFKDKTLNDIFEKTFNTKVIIKNNVHFMALGEYEKGTLTSNYNIATYLYLSYGIASCVLIDGKILTGYDGYAGEIGLNLMDSSKTMAEYCSITCLLKEASKIIGQCDFNQFLKAYETNDKIQKLVMESSHVVASFIINTSNLTGCNLYMLSNDALKFGRKYIDEIQKLVDDKCINKTKVIISTNDDSAFLGMLKVASDYARINYYKINISKIENNKK